MHSVWGLYEHVPGLSPERWLQLRSTVPGPIGAILMPGYDAARYRTLPYASSLCGSCREVCPVQIDIDEQLYAWRQEVGPRYAPRLKRLAMRLAARVLASPERYRWAGRLLRWSLRRLPRRVLYGPGTAGDVPASYPPPRRKVFWNGIGKPGPLPRRNNNHSGGFGRDVPRFTLDGLS